MRTPDAEPTSKGMVNAITVDVEDWIQSVYDPSATLTDHFAANTRRVLEHFAARRVRGTFFVLGLAAQKCPQLVREIAAAGHEVACHGFAHRPVHTQSVQQFREDVHRSKALLEDITGRAVTGYRAPQFSISERTLWAIDVLVELGFEYDSSIFPRRMRRYGMTGVPRVPNRARTAQGCTLLEVPVATCSWCGMTIPTAGGGYFRLLPLPLLAAGIRQINAQGFPATLYMHPYEYNPTELDRLPLRIPMRIRVHQLLGRWRFRAKVDRLLSLFRFDTVSMMLAALPTPAIHAYKPRSPQLGRKNAGPMTLAIED